MEFEFHPGFWGWSARGQAAAAAGAECHLGSLPLAETLSPGNTPTWWVHRHFTCDWPCTAPGPAQRLAHSRSGGRVCSL